MGSGTTIVNRLDREYGVLESSTRLGQALEPRKRSKQPECLRNPRGSVLIQNCLTGGVHPTELWLKCGRAIVSDVVSSVFHLPLTRL